MGKNKKNKRYKARCHNCGHRNKFALENWYGRSKTRCKNCGEFLDKVNSVENNNSNIIREVKQETMENQNNQNMNPELYEATRPVRNGDSQKRKRWYKKWWGFTLIILVLLCGAVTIYNVDAPLINNPSGYSVERTPIPQNINLNNTLAGEDLCLQLKYVPSWAKEGEVMKRGYAPLKQNVDYLIDKNITFLYSSTCTYCHKKIEDFGDDWQRYVDSGLTIECW